MTDETESLRAARDLYASMPDDMKAELMDAAWRATVAACEGSGSEPTPEIAASALVQTLRDLTLDAEARFHEITQEEMGRIIDEEYDRLCSDPDQGVPEEVLTAAVAKRVGEEYGYIVNPPRRRSPQ